MFKIGDKVMESCGFVGVVTEVDNQKEVATIKFNDDFERIFLFENIKKVEDI